MTEEDLDEMAPLIRQLVEVAFLEGWDAHRAYVLTGEGRSFDHPRAEERRLAAAAAGDKADAAWIKKKTETK